MIALLVMTDGRDDLLDRTLAAWGPVMGHPLVTERWVSDDTGDAAHRIDLIGRHRGFGCLSFDLPRLGFGGAIRHAWAQLSKVSSAQYVFHLEDDFVPVQPVDLTAMVEVLAARPHIAQMALRRQPWNDVERAAGGVVESRADEYTDVSDGYLAWLEHRLFWTTNPSLYRRSLCERGWPTGLYTEGRFGLDLFASDPTLRVAFWGARDSGVWVEHTGAVRVGTGY